MYAFINISFKKVRLRTSKSCINFMLATKKFITLILHAVVFNVMIELNPNLCIMNRAFIFKKRIKKSLKNVDNFSVSKLVAEEICQRLVLMLEMTIRPGTVILTWRRTANSRFLQNLSYSVSLILIRT